LAALAYGDRSGLLPLITAPTLVLHGNRDPLFSIAHAEHVAELVPNSSLKIIDGLGHSVEPILVPEISASIQGHIREADCGTNQRVTNVM
jgi:hypothetical protein